MKITADWLTAPASQAVCRALAAGGYQAWFVGGCVRNTLIGAAVSDLDISTDARPEVVMALAEAAGLKAVPTGIDHGTITVVAEGEPYEVTTFRRDIETFGRHAVVAFADTLDEDAHRRDFTMNALYADASGQVVDPVGGLPDLAARHVRFIGDAHARINEDYLRILRFFRFTAWYGAQDIGIDHDGLTACAAHLDGLSHLSAERVGAEILKLLAAPDPAPAVAAMAAIGVLPAILPGADAAALPVLVHLEGARAPDALRRLALLGGQDVADRLRLSNAARKRLDAIWACIETDLPTAALGYRYQGVAEDALLIRAARMGQEVSDTELSAIVHGAAQTFPVKPADLMPKLQGAALGQALRELEAAWVASDFTLTKAQLLSR